MSLRSSDASYRRYKQYRVNRHRFKTEQVTFPIAMLILIGIITKFWYLIIFLTSIFIVLYIVKYFNIEVSMEPEKTKDFVLPLPSKDNTYLSDLLGWDNPGIAGVVPGCAQFKKARLDRMGLFADGFKELKKASEPLYKTPKSIQETIEIMAVAENGIFEVSKGQKTSLNKFSKCYRFQDINYTTATEDEQIGIFERYCKFLNSLDCNYKITINNKNKNMEELREKVLIANQEDGFNRFRKIYNDIIEENILEGRHGIEQERYLTITIERKNFEEAKAQFATLEATIHKAFIELGAEIVPLSGNERLRVLYDYYHLGDEGSLILISNRLRK